MLGQRNDGFDSIAGIYYRCWICGSDRTHFRAVSPLFSYYVSGDMHAFGNIIAEEAEMIAFGQRFESHSFCGLVEVILKKKRSIRSK